MNVLVDSIECYRFVIIVSVIHEADDTLSIIEIESDNDLAYLGIKNASELEKDKTYTTEDEDGVHHITRIN